MSILHAYDGTMVPVAKVYRKNGERFRQVRKILRHDDVFQQVFGVTDAFILDGCYIYTNGVLSLADDFKACVNVEPQVDFVVDGYTLWKAYDPLPNPHRPDLGYSVTSLASTFYNYTDVTTLDLSNWDTSNVTSLYYTWYSCSSLTTLDLSNWDTSNVTTLHSTWRNCSSLTTLNLSNWDTNNVTNLTCTWYNCSSLTTLDISNWDVSNVTSLYSTWYNCSSLTTLDISNCDVNNVTSLYYTWRNCSSLTTLDLSNWDTNNVTALTATWYSCSSLTTLDISNWDVSNVTSLHYTWYSCSSLTTEITIGNPNLTSYIYAFNSAATADDTLITVNYTAECYDLAVAIVATKSSNSNVVLGSEVVIPDETLALYSLGVNPASTIDEQNLQLAELGVSL